MPARALPAALPAPGTISDQGRSPRASPIQPLRWQLVQTVRQLRRRRPATLSPARWIPALISRRQPIIVPVDALVAHYPKVSRANQSLRVPVLTSQQISQLAANLSLPTVGRSSPQRVAANLARCEPVVPCVRGPPLPALHLRRHGLSRSVFARLSLRHPLEKHPGGAGLGCRACGVPPAASCSLNGVRWAVLPPLPLNSYSAHHGASSGRRRCC